MNQAAHQLQENLIRFVHVLRHLGVPVNPAETLDALAAIEAVNLGDRSEVKAALRATLVKSETQTPLYDRAFDLFFAPPEVRRARVNERRQAREAREVALQRARTELVFQDQPLGLTPEQLEAYTRLGELQQERLRAFLAESSTGNNVDRSFEPLIESIVRGHLDRLRRHMEPERRTSPDLTGDEDLDTIIEGVLGGEAGKDVDPILHLDMKDISEADLPRATQLIRRLARRLATRLSRRYRETRKRRRPDMRRTIRSNIRHGGVLFDLRFRERKVERPRLLLICDVSGSMARYTAFILEFIFGLQAAVRGVEAFIFSEELERITDRLANGAGARAEGQAAGRKDPRGAPGRPGPAAGRPGSVAARAPGAARRSGPDTWLADARNRLTEAFMTAGEPTHVRGRAAGPAPGRFVASAQQVVAESRVWGKGTDLGAALETLFDDYDRVITRDTVVVIVSDTKTLSSDKAARLLGRLAPRVRDILWLNTLPREEWPEHRTVGLFARVSNMHECYTLAHLERVIRLGVGRHIRPA